MSLTAGTRLGPYEIVAPIGAGGMGEVYRAKDTNLNRDVALKILPESFALDADRVARFKREAQVLASLNHPNIAAIYGIESNALVMELVEGEDLSALISRGAIPLSDALPIARQIADALDAAHELGIIHRDLKPANIKVRADGTVKVLDFGLAKAVDPTDPSGAGAAMNSPTMTARATAMGMIIGTAAYMSPEQAKGKAVDKRADIWAFGVVLYEMLTGGRAFKGDDVSDTLVSVLRDTPDFAALPAATPLRLRLLLERCLDRDVKQRLRDIGEARVEIAKIERGAPDSVSAVTPAAVARHKAWRTALPWSLVAVLAIALAASSLRVARTPSETVRFTVVTPGGVSRLSGAGFAVSPDGQTLAFAATADGGVTRIFTRRLDESDARPVPGTDNASLPFWSPDSRSLGFTKEGALFRIARDGGAPRQLCTIPGRIEAARYARSVATWGPAGVIVFAGPDGPLYRVDEAGGTPAPLTSLDLSKNERAHRSPWFLPDGRHVLFLALSFSNRGAVWAVSIENPTQRTRVAESSGGAAFAGGMLLTTTAAPRALIAQPFDPVRLVLNGAPQQVRDRMKIASTLGESSFSVSVSGTLVVDRSEERISQLTWRDRAGRVAGTVGSVGRIADFALSPDGRQVIVNMTDPSSLKSDLWLSDGGQLEGTRLTFQTDTRRPMWALDGRHVFFTTLLGSKIWSLALGASQLQLLDNPGEFAHFEDRTSDGRYFVFKSRGAPSEVWIQRVGTPAERRALVQSQSAAVQPRVSPDGRWLAYTLRAPGGDEVFVQPFDRPGDRQQVSRTGGSGPIWRADSRELYFEADRQLMVVTTTERVGTLDIGTPQKLFPIHTQGVGFNQPHNVEVAENGQRFLVNTIVGNSDNEPLEVTLNWTKAVKK